MTKLGLPVLVMQEGLAPISQGYGSFPSLELEVVTTVQSRQVTTCLVEWQG